MTFKTQKKLNNSVKMRNTTWSPKRTGILLEFPKKGKKIPTKENKTTVIRYFQSTTKKTFCLKKLTLIYQKVTK